MSQHHESKRDEPAHRVGNTWNSHRAPKEKRGPPPRQPLGPSNRFYRARWLTD